MTNILVTGGAGYIGSHVCATLVQHGFTPISLDLVRWGGRAWKETFGTITDRTRLDDIMWVHKPKAIIHLAAFTSVEQSVSNSRVYYANNVGGSLAVIEAAESYDVPIIYSSSCAIFGNPLHNPVAENDPYDPISPYARTKLMVEQILEDSDLSSVCLRYFNAAGALPELGHKSTSHLIPNLIRAAKTGEPFTIYGNDFPTPDKTAIRDYVHVLDLAEAHVLALRYLLDGGYSTAIHLGSGIGSSVREVISAAEKVGLTFSKIISQPRRPGDPPAVYADIRKAKSVLGWAPQRDLEEMIRSEAL